LSSSSGGLRLDLRPETTEASLFDRIVAASGLTPVVAPYTIRRLLRRGNIVPPERVTVEELRALLPDLLAELRVYLDREGHDAVSSALSRLAE
jgi:hypothetical protein